MRKLRTIATTALVVGAVLVGAVGMAGAVLTVRTGGIVERNVYVAESNAWTTTNGFWTNVPGASATLTLPANRIISARFTAESACEGAGGWCSVRVVVVRPNGSTLELFPVSGTDFAFDTADPDTTDTWESHAIERSSAWQVAGTYRLLVQATVVGASSIRLDDWHLTASLTRP